MSPAQLLRDRRCWLLVAIISIVAAARLFHLNGYLSIAALAENRVLLLAFVSRHMVIAVVTFVAAYVSLVALSLPGSQIMTIASGFLFGAILGTVLSVVGATVGAVLIFVIVTRVIGPAALSRMGTRVEAIAAAIRSEAWSYLLVLRLFPVAPFFAVNLAAALVGIQLRTFALTTLVGIIPGAFAYAMFGAGLGTMFEAGQVPGFTELLTPQLLFAIGSLAALAILAIPVKRYVRRRGGPSPESEVPQ